LHFGVPVKESGVIAGYALKTQGVAIINRLAKSENLQLS
jgi:hypothetical protein